MLSSLFTTQPWLNRAEFTDIQLALFALGCLGWVVAYVGVARMLRQRRFVEIPAGAVAANIAWEFVWGFLYGSNMGRLFTLGYALWCIQDVYITWSTFRYGDRQIDNPHLRRWFRPAFAFGIVAWGLGIYWFVADGYDTGYGAISGYVLNVMMSALYVVLLLKHDVRDFSVLVGWSKMLGTLLLSVFNAMVRPEDLLLMSLCTITFGLDVAYLGLLHAKRATLRAPSPAAPAMGVAA
jgi:hypothetical protein